MTETEIFNYILKNDLKTGPNRLLSNKKVESSLKISKLGKNKWIIDSMDNNPISDQVIYDIFKLGLTSIDQRPKCPFCGDPIRFYDLRRGYKKSCDKKECFKRHMKEIVWGDSKYRENQTRVHKEWAKIPKNREYLVQRTLNTWKDEKYREKQIDSHKKWASIPKNQEIMSNRTKILWRNPEYRKRLVNSHKNWAKNNPDKVGYNSPYKTGKVYSKKMNTEIKFDSSWEKRFIELCDKLDEVVEITRPDFHIEYEFKGDVKSYFPDFVITTKNRKYLIEIKSSRMVNNEIIRKKLEAGRLFINSNNLGITKFIVLTEKELFTTPSCKDINTKLIKKILN